MLMRLPFNMEYLTLHFAAPAMFRLDQMPYRRGGEVAAWARRICDGQVILYLSHCRTHGHSRGSNRGKKTSAFECHDFFF